MADDDIRVKYWLRFFREAGLNRVDSVKYAKSFIEQDVKVKSIYKKLEHEDSIHCVKFLQLLGVKLGHTDQIIDQAKKEIAGQGEPQVDFVKVDEAATEDESATTMVDSKPCIHPASQKCLNCAFCNKHMNEKSLVRHIRGVHSLERTPSRKLKRKSCILETSTSSGPSCQQLKSSTKPILLEDLSDDNIDTVPPVISRYTASPMEVVELDISNEQETDNNSLTSCDLSCTPQDLHLSHQNGLLEMEDLIPSISVVSSKSDPTASEGTMQATSVVNIAGCSEASALLPQASSAHLFYPNQASLANLPQASLESSAHLPQPSQVSSAHLPQPSQVSSAHLPPPSQVSSAHLPQPSQVSSAHLPQPSQVSSAYPPQPRQASFANPPEPILAISANLPLLSHRSSAILPQINLATSAHLSQSGLASSVLITGYGLLPPDCVKPLFHLRYPDPTLTSHHSVQLISRNETVANTAVVDGDKLAPTLPVIGTAWSCSQYQGAASLIFSSGRERRAVCRVGQAEQAGSSVHRIRIMLVDQALETIQDMLK